MIRDLSCFVCDTCGWWKIVGQEEDTFDSGSVHYANLAGTGTLQVFGDPEPTEAIGEARAVLRRDFRSASSSVDPHRFEDVVGSLLRDMGYQVRVVGTHHGDDGIDIVLDGPDNQQVAVQVKRTKRTVQLSVIRELVGALVIKGLTRGLVVTTSDFTSGADRTLQLLDRQGICVELVNGARFLQALEVAERKPYSSTKELLSTIEGGCRNLRSFNERSESYICD